MKRNRFILQAIFACLIFLSIFQSAYGVCTPQSAVIWVNGDDNSSVWINGNYLGGVNYVNWDSPSDPVSLNVPIAYLNASGDNVIAIAVTDTAGGQIWGSFALDVTCVGGMHAYVSSNDGGIKLSATNAYNTPPAANWYASAFVDTAWGNAVAMSVTTWAKPLYDPSDGKVVVPYSYDGVGSSGANEWDPSGMNMLYMRKHFTLNPVVPLPSATITIMKSASMTSQIPGGPVTFTLQICNTGGYTRKPILISDYWVSNAACVWSMGGPYYWDDLNNGQLYRNAATPDRFTLYYPLGMEAGVCKTFVYEMNPCWFPTDWETTAWCTTATNYSTVTWTTGSATDDLAFTIFCPSKTRTPSRTVTPAMSPTFTRTPSSTSSRTMSPTYTRTPSPAMTFTFTRTSSPTHTRTVTPTYTMTPTATRTRTMTGTYTRTPTVAITNTFTRSATASVSPSNTFTRTPTASPTFTRTVTVTYSLTATQAITFTFTRTVSPSYTRTVTATYTRTVMPTLTFTGTRTATSTFTRTATPTHSGTITFSATGTHTRTRTPTFTATQTVTITSMNTPTVTPTISPTFTRTGTPTHTRTATPSPTGTHTRTSTPTFTATQTITITSMNTATVTVTISPTFTRTGTPTHTRTATPSPTGTYTGTATPTFTATQTVTITSMNTATVTRTITQTSTATPTYSVTFTYTATYTLTATPTVTETSMNTATVTNTVTPSFTYTVTRTPTPSFTATPTVTITSLDTATVTRTVTDTCTETPTFSSTMTITVTYTWTYTQTFTATDTATETVTETGVNTATFTHSVTPSFTVTLTETGTCSFTPTFTVTASATVTMTITVTCTRTFTLTVTYSPTPAGTPALLTISMSVAGDNPQPGSQIVYWIMVENKDTQPAYNIRVWDSLPPEVEFLGMSSGQAPVINGNLVTWDFPADFVLMPGQTTYVQFNVKITSSPGTGVIDNRASVDYNDPYYTSGTGRHPAITCSDIQFPEEMPVAYPNPFSWANAVNNELKFANVPPGSTIQIYTVSGERVISIEVKFTRASWNGRNSAGLQVSPGIYYYVIRNMFSSEAVSGKIFIVK